MKLLSLESSDTSAHADQVRIEVHFGFSRIVPNIPEVLIRDLLEYSTPQFEDDEEFGYREQKNEFSWGRYDIKNRLEVPTGMVTVVAERLRAVGYDVHLTDHRKFRKRLAEETAAIADADEYEIQEMLKSVRREPIGRIESGGINDKVKRAAAICRMYPQARVLFPVASYSEGRDLRWRLRKELEHNIAFTGLRRHVRTPRYAICTYARLYHLDSSKYDLLLLTDPTQALGIRAAKSMSNFAFFSGRVYSFVPPQMKLSHRERIWLTVMSGPVIHRQSDDLLGVHVVWLSTPSCSAIGDCTGLEFKRQAYWHNSRRNDYIAAAARAFAAYDWPKLKKYGVSTAYTPLVVDDQPRNPLVVVLVESTEHGLELQSRLNDWTLLSKTPDAKKHSSNDGKAAGYIVTLTAAKEHKIPAEVLINATGGQGKPHVNGFPKIQWADDPDSLLVDFKDESDKRTSEQAEQRRRRYSVVGWRDSVPPIFGIVG